jgi:hypothetical protein
VGFTQLLAVSADMFAESREDVGSPIAAAAVETCEYMRSPTDVTFSRLRIISLNPWQSLKALRARILWTSNPTSFQAVSIAL